MGILNRSDVAGDGVRFTVAGLINTGLTIFVYQTLLSIMSGQAAYAISWVVGLLFVAVVYPERVFVGGRRSLTARIVLVVFYAGLFLLGLCLMNILDGFGISARVSIFIVVVCIALANFIVSRTLLRGG